MRVWRGVGGRARTDVAHALSRHLHLVGFHLCIYPLRAQTQRYEPCSTPAALTSRDPSPLRRLGHLESKPSGAAEPVSCPPALRPLQRPG